MTTVRPRKHQPVEEREKRPGLSAGEARFRTRPPAKGHVTSTDLVANLEGGTDCDVGKIRNAYEIAGRWSKTQKSSRVA